MSKTIKARYAHGVLEPLEPLELEEGKELVVTIEEPPSAEDRFEQAAGSWAGLIDAEEFLRDIYLARSLPRDVDRAWGSQCQRS